jgi:methyl-accepting chemotaxis protein
MQLSFRSKLLVPLAICWISLWIVTAVQVFQTKDLRLEERRQALKSATEIGVSITKEYAEQVTAGRLTLAEAQQQAQARIKAARFGTDGYLTILSSDARVIMHPLKPDLDGKDMSGFHDANGTFVFREMAQIAKTSGAGWVEYVWPKPGHTDQTRTFEKGSFVSTYKPWDWTFVAGVYFDDLNDALLADFGRAFLLLCVVGVFLNASILLVIRSVERSVGGDPNDAVSAARRIASGDLSSDIPTKQGDSTSLMFAMRTMQANLVDIVARVRSGTDTFVTATQEIVAGNLDLSSRTEQQAAFLEETASSLEQLTVTVKQNAGQATRANEMAAMASEMAGKGGDAVTEVVETMFSINESARKIQDIIGVIDGIALQTNILALNASVEASRAGQQGRGFAVVASEVRVLAHSSGAAAREIKALIENSVDRVRKGTALADQAKETIHEVVNSVNQVSRQMNEITSASHEQNAGIEQINQAIVQLGQVAQQNAALVEESAASAAIIRKHATDLATVVDIFKVGLHSPGQGEITRVSQAG